MTKSKTDAGRRRSKDDGRALIGWREWASFPDLGVERINAKIDTGAKSSAIHAFRMSVTEANDGAWVEFYLHPRRRRKAPEIFCRTPLIDTRLIKSSNGQTEERLVINTPLRMGDQVWPVELTLTNRDEMGYRLLIGRDALARRFLIKPDASYLLGKKPPIEWSTK